MQQRSLGRTGISVSRICLGTMTWGEQNTEAEGHAQMNYALDQGINFLDTAELYSTPARAGTQGASETIIGAWLKANGRRDDWVIASKITGRGHDWIRGGRPMDGREVTAALEASLRRLGTDHIDLYQLHWPNRAHYNFSNAWSFNPHGQDRAAILDNLLDTLQALDAAKKAGKIRAIGVSNETSWGLSHYLALAERHGLARMATIQNEYNLLRRHCDLDLAEICAFEDVGLLAYSPLAAGLLSGKYNDGRMPDGSRGALGVMWRHNPQSEIATKAYMTLAGQHGLDPCQMAIAFCLTRPFMASVIIGATTMEQLSANIAAERLVLSDAVLQGIEDLHRLYPRTIA
ncbi:aldo/keto reductase [Pelagibacterium lacus]|uniref:Aldo/keto reductase n=1 Tax=Pelagibacterium lacus TaxID=2282655 RepID=A0A369W165_9HYPH|nr:aldo/keto reductase [Pelagibacterium lacus]RDE07697.1 aldo/keto reductase [Pelagibacterium lacus]